jgi:mRNA interferase HigB
MFINMQIVARRTLKLFWNRHPSAEAPMKVWYALVSKAAWTGPSDVKAMFGATVDFVGDSRVIFDIGGNKFRIVAHVAYRYGRVLVKFVGTHKAYDKINAETEGN